MTPEQGAKALEQLGDKLRNKVVTNALRRAVRRAATNALRFVRQAGLGRALWQTRNSKKASGSGTPPLIIRASRLKKDSLGYTTAIEASGIAAMIETGGQIKPHRITAKRASSLRFQLGNGQWFTGPAVTHPGAKVVKRPFLQRAGQEAITQMPAEVSEGAIKAAREVGF